MGQTRAWRGVLIGVVALSIAAPAIFGQTGQGARSNRDLPMPSEQARQRQQQLYIQGDVVFEDGTPAPVNVLIERFCGSGNAIPETYTDSKGRFSFQLGKGRSSAPFDAARGYGTSRPGGTGEELTPLSGYMSRDFPNLIGENDLAGCTLRAVLPGFRSTTLDLGPRGSFDDPDVGDIVLAPFGDVEGLSLSLVSLRAPDDARSSFEKGMEEFEKRKWKNARTHFEDAVETYPRHADAWFGLGRTYEEQKRPDEARKAFETAAAADPRFVPPLLGLARLDAGETTWDAVAKRTDRILAMNPNDFPEAYFYNAVANFNQERYPAAEKSAEEAIARGAEPQFPQVVHLLAMSFGYQGKAEEAIVQLKHYLEIAPDGDTAPAARQQLEGLESYLAKQRASAAQP